MTSNGFNIIALGSILRKTQKTEAMGNAAQVADKRNGVRPLKRSLEIPRGRGMRVVPNVRNLPRVSRSRVAEATLVFPSFERPDGTFKAKEAVRDKLLHTAVSLHLLPEHPADYFIDTSYDLTRLIIRWWGDPGSMFKKPKRGEYDEGVLVNNARRANCVIAKGDRVLVEDKTGNQVDIFDRTYHAVNRNVTPHGESPNVSQAEPVSKPKDSVM
jgi:hypothetical protein